MKSIKILDGATGTMLWEKAQAAGLEKVSTWRYNKEAPQLVEELHAQYAAAGSQIIYTNTFCANIPAAESEGFDAEEIIKLGVELARKGAEKGAKRKAPKVALDFGPLFRPMEPFGPTTEEECRAFFSKMCPAGADADLIVLETFMDTASLAIAAEEAKKTGLPVFCSMSFEKGSRTFFGADIDSMLAALLPLEVDAVGLNCSFGPEKAIPVIKEFAEKTDLPLLLKPNTADLPPEDFAKALVPALPYVSYLGSCCGSSPEYIRAIKSII